MVRYLIPAVLLAFGAEAAHARDTELCNTRIESSTFVEARSLEAANAIAQAATSSQFTNNLWNPLSVSVSPLRFFNPLVVFTFAPAQDVVQIAAAIGADPVLAQMGVVASWVNGNGCSIAPPPAFQTIREYWNRNTGHYFLATQEWEAVYIARGDAGPGWEATGETFEAQLPNADCRNWMRVHRFYAPGANSHFYTASPQECGGLRKSGTGWGYEYVAFHGAVPDAAGNCPSWASAPVYRAYNNRWRENDSNHRFTVKPEIYRQMLDRGWAGEGISLCVAKR